MAARPKIGWQEDAYTACARRDGVWRDFELAIGSVTACLGDEIQVKGAVARIDSTPEWFSRVVQWRKGFSATFPTAT